MLVVQRSLYVSFVFRSLLMSGFGQLVGESEVKLYTYTKSHLRLPRVILKGVRGDRPTSIFVSTKYAIVHLVAARTNQLKYFSLSGLPIIQIDFSA